MDRSLPTIYYKRNDMAKFTRRAIFDAFLELLREKSLDKITVKEIIETAEINRNTFYYHFQNIDDLLEKTFQDASDTFREESNPDRTFYEEYVRTAEYLQSHKEAILHVYDSKSQDVLSQYLDSAISHFVGRFVVKAAEGTRLSQAGIDYITYFYTYAFIGATLRWVEDRMPDYRDDLNRTIAESFEATIDPMIQMYIKGHS